MTDHDIAARSTALYANGESMLEAAKKCTGSRKMYRDCAEMSYYAILYGIKDALAVDDALPENQDEAFQIFKEFHVGTETFPEECWLRLRAVKALHETCLNDLSYEPVVEEVTESVESAEYMLLLTNMFLSGRGVSV